MNEWIDVIYFDKNSGTKSSEKSITLYQTTAKTINMAFNSSITKDIEEEYLNLAYSKKKNAIVIFLSNENNSNSYKITKSRRGFTISIQKFLNSFNIDKNEVIGKYLPIEDIINDKFCWIIYLKKEVPCLV